MGFFEPSMTKQWKRKIGEMLDEEKSKRTRLELRFDCLEDLGPAFGRRVRELCDDARFFKIQIKVLEEQREALELRVRELELKEKFEVLELRMRELELRFKVKGG